ncbi:MAG: hypothetical protein PWP34_2437 [Desulfuromonadales bacterium]|jgi:hypothetical protein|nr:hypothetical protein [Desulfuromonadales bacterium]
MTNTDAAPTLAPAALQEKDAAEYIGMSVHFLRADRLNGHLPNRTPGPPFLKIGRAIRYRVADLDEWLQERLVDRRRA